MIKAIADFRAGKCNRIAVAAAVAAVNVEMGLSQYKTDDERDLIISEYNKKIKALGALSAFIRVVVT